jgi:RNA-directed DNA polymerase
MPAEESALTSGVLVKEGTRTAAYRAVRHHAYESVRHFLRRRHQVQSRGTSRFSKEAVFGELGVLPLRRARMAPRS